MATVNIYLTFNENCEEVFNFYQSVFGGEFSYIGRYKDIPQSEDCKTNKADDNKIMHIALPISNETCLMGSDIAGEWGANYKEGNNFSISINAENKAEADKFFNALSAGGKVSMPMTNTFWGAYFGTFTDKFGINWMVNFDENSTTK